MGEVLTVDRPAEGVARLTLQRPERRNALSTELRDRISDAVDGLVADEEVRVLVFTGAGEVFCAGFDLDELTASIDDPGLSKRLWASSDRYHRTVLTCPLPTVAVVNGPAIAGGFDLAVMCDIRLASETARFAHPEAKWGDVVYGPLHDLVGGGVARDLCLTGRSIDAAEAKAMGLVSQVVPGADLGELGIGVAAGMAETPRELLMRTKSKMLRRARVEVGGTLDL